MGVFDRLQAALGRLRVAGPAAVPVVSDAVMDLPLQIVPTRQVVAEEVTLQRRAVVTDAVALHQAAEKREALTLASGLSIDSDDFQYRRLGSGSKNRKRDLTPIQQDRMLEIAWYLWEQNPFAKRLITFSTDLILGGGVTVQADDPRVQEAIDQTWNHRINQLRTRLPEFHNSLELNGELILPVEVNPVTGRPVLGFIDPSMVLTIDLNPMNSLLPEYVVLRAEPGSTAAGQRLRIIHENPVSGMLEGEVFYLGINKLPNSSRGRSSLLPLADWLDLYDQYLFAEVERLHLLSSFVWDYKVEGATADEIAAKVKALPNPKPGSVFGHNEKETLEARTPDLKAADRSEAGRMLRTHIAGSYGFPLSYLGETDSNRATIEGQNDVMMKTPARKQLDFAAFIELIVTFTVQQHIGKNRALFRDASQKFKIQMPEIAAKDVSRVGQVLAQVVGAMDTAMSNRTASRQLAVTVTLALLKHLGVEADAAEVIAQADLEAEERQALVDAMQARMAKQSNDAMGGGDDPDDPDDPDDEADDEDEAEGGAAGRRGREAEAAASGAHLRDVNERVLDLLDRQLGQPAPAPPAVHVKVESPQVSVTAPPVTVNATIGKTGGGTKVVERDAEGRIARVASVESTQTVQRDAEGKIVSVVEE